MSSTDDVILTIDQSGSIAAVWDDILAPLVEIAETVECRRVSHVEMIGGRWIADLSLVGGPKLPGCRRRADALAAERRWLAQHLEIL